MYVVVGGGVTGLFTALFLAREGAEVAVVEGGGAWSRAAAGVLEPTKFEINMINVRGFPRRYLRMWLRGAARVRRLDWRWLWTYLKVYGRSYPQELWESVKWLGDFSVRQYADLAEAANDFEFRKDVLYELVEDVEEEAARLEKDPLKPRFELAEVEGKRAIVYLDPYVLSTDLAAERLRRELEAARVQLIDGKVAAVARDGVELEGGKRLAAERVVVAAGWWARRLGVLVAPFKGYGFRVRASFSRTLADFVGGVFLVPFSKWTKVTGRFDLDSTEDHSPAQKVLEAARHWLPALDVIDMAVGYRPCTPDGVPIVEERGGVVVATGACRLGWTYGPALGKLAADLALGRVKETPLNSGRFLP